ncbi:uncharacterized protein L969DRAFT_46893 [Mixia osmundae IAM 14324]|uniref:50S ribosomal protein L31, chloroplastic n=1 Tax=Mixia osmundae (strain CBS 9802 / IAM 14324 / JCM 22182 / KY 12970) TaxID=764103 RepID=G7E5G2_MIXOS|nr:uncharacterized protein L969DRAFT_46893 [Mixia osmundae IAM 14324]KEI40777.1 hypothetical protein L969DRAFT_46893 [Mixia osmundae IAM 14324]GAA98072.1 hypothetical protein E5Q_04754 [Mixia osmundae IAM 14324]
MKPRCQCACAQLAHMARSFSTSSRASVIRSVYSKTTGKPRYAVPPRLSRLPPAKPRQFLSKVELPDASTLMIQSTCPRNVLPLTKSTVTHPLWGFTTQSRLRDGQVQDESGRLAKFAARFGAAQDTPTDEYDQAFTEATADDIAKTGRLAKLAPQSKKTSKRR